MLGFAWGFTLMAGSAWVTDSGAALAMVSGCTGSRATMSRMGREIGDSTCDGDRAPIWICAAGELMARAGDAARTGLIEAVAWLGAVGEDTLLICNVGVAERLDALSSTGDLAAEVDANREVI
jgi:hypothetical protein